jgi:hypothetical protein
MSRHERERAAGRKASASGRFVLRLDPALHSQLRGAAAQCGVSLNEYCSRKLAAPTSSCMADQGLAAAVSRASSLFGDRLIAVAAFGSWIRGEAAATSDIDLLVVLDARVALTRALYRRWDEGPVTALGRRVEPHFAHLPDPTVVVGGVWAEVALDGVVLFERELQLSTRLALVRRQILSGRLVRRIAHGQPYWAEVA